MKQIVVIALSALILTASAIFLWDYGTMWDSVPAPRPTPVEPGATVPEPAPSHSQVIVEVPPDQKNVEVRVCDPKLSPLETFCK